MRGGGRGGGRQRVAEDAVLLPVKRCQEKVVGTSICSGRTGVQRNSVTEVRLRRERVTKQEPNPDLPLSVADSQWCPPSLQVVLTLFTVWADANLMMLQDEK